MKVADLHIHTKASDSSNSPEEAVRRAKKENLAAIAITDHDTVAGIEPALKVGSEMGVEIVPGIEIACSENGVNFELLGYWIDYENDSLRNTLQELQEYREVRAQKIVEKLQKNGVDLSFQRILETAGGGVLGRIHVAWCMYKDSHVESVDEAFKKYLREGKPAFVEKKRFSLKGAASLIHESGGVVVLAHPRYGGLELLDELLEEGMKGIEVYHSMHEKEGEEKYHKVAQEHNLLEVGGSDSHGKYLPHSPIGNVSVDYEVVKRLENLKP